MVHELDHEAKDSLIVFPFEKPQSLSISYIDQFRNSGVASPEDIGHYWRYEEASDGLIKEGITLNLNEQHCPVRDYRVASVTGFKIPPEIYSEMPSVKIRIIPRVILCSNGIGVCLQAVRCVFRPTIPQKFAYSKSKAVQELLRYYENFQPRKSVPFSNYYTIDGEGYLCLDGNDNVIMQSAYEYALEETQKLFLHDKKRGAYLGASFDSIRVIEEDSLQLIFRNGIFYTFFNIWGKAVSDRVLKIISNFNMGYANGRPNPLLKLPEELMEVYSKQLIKEGVKQNKVCWSVSKPVQNEPQVMQGGVLVPNLLGQLVINRIGNRGAEEAAEIPDEVEEVEEDFDEDPGEGDGG